MKEMEERIRSLEEENGELQETLQQSQTAADQWNLLLQSADTATLKRFLDEAAQKQKRDEEEWTRKTAHHLEEAKKSEAKARKAREKANNIQQLMNTMPEDEENIVKPMENSSDA